MHITANRDLELKNTLNEARGSVIAAVIRRKHNSFELITSHGNEVWLNGMKVEVTTLKTGDFIEIGGSATVLRFRLNVPRIFTGTSVSDIVNQRIEYTKKTSGTPIGKGIGFLTNLVKDLAIQTSVWFRIVVVFSLLVLAAAIVFNTYYSHNLEQRLAQGQFQISSLAELLQQADRRAIHRDEFKNLQEGLKQAISGASERLDILEKRSDAARDIIATSEASVYFIAGSFGYQDPETKAPLRLAVNADGSPAHSLFGHPGVSIEGNGPALEITFTGTAFMVDDRFTLLTNRHVAVPWNNHPANTGMLELGLEPVMRKLVGYPARGVEPAVLVAGPTSEHHDLAVLRSHVALDFGQPLEFSHDQPKQGDDIFLLGYPAGIRALLARVGTGFFEKRDNQNSLGFWDVTQELAAEGFISPLASRGIIGYISEDVVVYDAETAQGGSGSPVLTTDGKVIAINTAVMPEFGGSNIGIPIRYAEQLLLK